MRIIISFFILLIFEASFGINGIQTVIENKKATYKVQPKDTWTNLSKKFNTSIKELQNANAGIKDLKIGEVIQIPSSASGNDKSSVTQNHSSGNKSSAKKPVYYSVKPHETLYRISVNNKVSVDDLKKWNNLNSNNVSID